MVIIARRVTLITSVNLPSLLERCHSPELERLLWLLVDSMLQNVLLVLMALSPETGLPTDAS